MASHLRCRHLEEFHEKIRFESELTIGDYAGEVFIPLIRFQIFIVNPQALVAQKIADLVIFRRFQGEGVEFFFKSDLTDPHQIFDAHLLVNTDLSPRRFHF